MQAAFDIGGKAGSPAKVGQQAFLRVLEAVLVPNALTCLYHAVLKRILVPRASG